MEAYRRTVRINMQKRRTQLAAKFGRAWQVAEQGAALLKSEFGAERVAVFGSLLAPNLFHHRSDVDLAVWGLPEDDYFRAVGRLQSLDGQISVDLVVVEMASPRLQKKIAHEGKLL